jgi:hypothetical protein
MPNSSPYRPTGWAASRRVLVHAVRFVQFGFTPSGSALDRIAELATRGAVRPFLERVLPFTAVAQAHALSEAARART